LIYNNDNFFILLFIFLALSILLVLLRFLFLNKLRRVILKSKNDFDNLFVELAGNFSWIALSTFSLFLAIEFSGIEGRYRNTTERVLFIIIAFFFTRALVKIIHYVFKRVLISQKERTEDYDPTMLKVLRRLVGGLVWVVALLFILENYGYDVSTIVGGLGIAGIAVAFGLQSILEDIFSFFTIYFDKPFQIGDFIVVDKDMGTVKKIGLKSTRVKTMKGHDLILSNKQLTQARINNYHSMTRRRVQFEIGVKYGTAESKLEKIPKIVEKIVMNIENAEFGRTHLKELGSYGLIFEIVFYVNSGNYELYMDIRQKVNFEILKNFEKEKIEIALPLAAPTIVQ